MSSPRFRLLPLLPAAAVAAAACVAAGLVPCGECATAVGSGVHGLRRPTTGPADAVAGAAGSMSEGGVISNGRVGCFGGALSARAVCLRTRGGSIYEVNQSP